MLDLPAHRVADQATVVGLLTEVDVLLRGLNESTLQLPDGRVTRASCGSASPVVARLPWAVMGTNRIGLCPRRDRFGLIRNVVAAGAHVENDVRHRLQDMLARRPA